MLTEDNYDDDNDYAEVEIMITIMTLIMLKKVMMGRLAFHLSMTLLHY